MPPARPAAAGDNRYNELGKLFAEFMDKGFQIYSGGQRSLAPVDICITGASLGLPGVDGVFSDSNVERMLRGDVFINPIPSNLRQEMVEKTSLAWLKQKEAKAGLNTLKVLPMSSSSPREQKNLI